MVRDYKEIKKGIKVLAENNLDEAQISKVTHIKIGENSRDRYSIKYFLNLINRDQKRFKNKLDKIASKIVDYFIPIGWINIFLVILFIFLIIFFVENTIIAFLMLMLPPIIIFLVSVIFKIKKIKIDVNQFLFLNLGNIILITLYINAMINFVYSGLSMKFLFVGYIIIFLILMITGSFILGFKKISLFVVLILSILVYAITFSFLYPSENMISDNVNFAYLKKEDSLNFNYISAITNFISPKKQELLIDIRLDNLLENNTFIMEINTNRNVSEVYFGYNTSEIFNLNKINESKANITLISLGYYRVYYKINTENVIPKGRFRFSLSTNRPQKTSSSPLELGFIINEIFYRCDENCISEVYGVANFTKRQNTAQVLKQPTGLNNPVRINSIYYQSYLPRDLYGIRIYTKYNITLIIQLLLLALMTGVIILFLTKVYEK